MNYCLIDGKFRYKFKIYKYMRRELIVLELFSAFIFNNTRLKIIDCPYLNRSFTFERQEITLIIRAVLYRSKNVYIQFQD